MLQTPPCRTERRARTRTRPQDPARRSALTLGMNSRTSPAVKTQISNESFQAVPAPPVPLASRPVVSSSCLHCRDFSIVDQHASQFPRQEFTSLDNLADSLCRPFSSSTDRARCIFTWMHHNIAYDVVAFFNNAVKPSTPQSTLESGLGVCQGYACLYQELATRAGLECVVVTGHGKGFGFAAGQSVPASPSGHAWNAVRIDDGHWKLIDPCWGAGHISGPGKAFTPQFSPQQFTLDNVEFGLRHFPADARYFFAPTPPPTWEEYYLGPLRGAECLQVYSGVAAAEGISQTSFVPAAKHISLTAAQSIRFSFSRICPHWSPTKNGPGESFVYVLQTRGSEYQAFETDGMTWWLDVDVRLLGQPGEQVLAFAVDSVDGQSGRGLSVPEYRDVQGRKGMGFSGLALWSLIR